MLRPNGNGLFEYSDCDGFGLKRRI
jgi:hypothetical protein